jgi:hypothetical protein
MASPSADLAEDVSGLPPYRPAEIDLVVTGERASAGPDGAADQRAFKGSANHPSAERPDSGANPAAAYRAIAGAVAAPTEPAERKQANRSQRDPPHDFLQEVVYFLRIERGPLAITIAPPGGWLGYAR